MKRQMDQWFYVGTPTSSHLWKRYCVRSHDGVSTNPPPRRGLEPRIASAMDGKRIRKWESSGGAESGASRFLKTISPSESACGSAELDSGDVNYLELLNRNPELRSLVERWEGLSHHIKAAIIALLRASRRLPPQTDQQPPFDMEK